MTYWGSRDDMLWEPASDSSNLTTPKSRLDSRLRMSGMTYWGESGMTCWGSLPLTHRTLRRYKVDWIPD